ncbi:hypothetical protein MMC25_003174 [Agyrium rufum]|nr:hypothetical protein [Agyrium rufum]
MAHPRSIYKDDVDFSALALQDKDFNAFVKPNGQLDFSNPEAVKQLTKSLLKRDFNLRIELPDDRLCPPVPNRLNYILWLQDLLDTTSDSYTDQYDPSREVIGLDIGTGASCIYPLLGCRQRPKWRFAASDIDKKNLEYARNNIIANNLKSDIRPLLTLSDEPLIPLSKLGIEELDFTMCNPPFYNSEASLLSSAAAKSRPPHSACTGAAVEMVTLGGEVAFVTRMIEESCILREQVQWYTSMLGKLGSISALIETLKGKRCGNWAVTEFVQGERTRRWGLAWSWRDMRPPVHIARHLPSLPKHLLPFPAEFTIDLASKSIDAVAMGLNEILSDLDLHWRYRKPISTGIGFAKENVWSRSARRAKAKRMQMSASRDSPDLEARTQGLGLHGAGNTAEKGEEDSGDHSEPALGFKVEIRREGGMMDEMEDVRLSVRWLKGRDSVLFESFCGMLKRQLERSIQ